MKTRDWIRYEDGRKRDWRADERFRKDDAKLFLQRAKKNEQILP